MGMEEKAESLELDRLGFKFRLLLLAVSLLKFVVLIFLISKMEIIKPTYLTHRNVRIKLHHRTTKPSR